MFLEKKKKKRYMQIRKLIQYILERDETLKEKLQTQSILQESTIQKQSNHKGEIKYKTETEQNHAL